jgi:hypothetical protein
MKKLFIVLMLVLFALTFMNCTKCDCEVCCELLGISSCAVEEDVKKDDCSLEGQGLTGICTAECK